MGGEKTLYSGIQRVVLGSPPHGRGKACSGPPGCRTGPITPAWAGKSYHSWHMVIVIGDHPRMGGEKFFALLQPLSSPGSPPHGRGKVSMAFLIMFLHGITPAWAGKSRECRYGLTRGWDHPRMGGEKDVIPVGTTSRRGSPPHGRGKAVIPARQAPAARITPAWAGKSGSESGYAGAGQDHPRMGGEKFPVAFQYQSNSGSPPRGRGKGEGCPAERAEDRITPAWAGKRNRSRIQNDEEKDHPRMGGEKFR